MGKLIFLFSVLFSCSALAQPYGPGPTPGGGGGGTPANPTATAGPAAINGSATTYMRSDAAPSVQKGTNAQFGIVEGDGVSLNCVLGVCSSSFPALSAQTSSFNVGAGQMSTLQPVNISGGGTITLPASGFASTYFLAGQLACLINTGATADTVTNSTGATVAPALATLIPGGLLPGAQLCLQSDGTNLYATLTIKDAVSLSTASQIITGGFHPTAFSNGTATTGTTTIDCGNGTIQSLTNGGSFTFAMSANDGQCTVRITNNGSAGTITFSGFSQGSNSGDGLTSTNGNKFDVTLSRIGGSPHYLISALQ